MVPPAGSRGSARSVAENFHQAMEGTGSRSSAKPEWRPSLGRTGTTFEMTDLLFSAFGGRKSKVNPARRRLTWS